jgi:hypothetical protein
MLERIDASLVTEWESMVEGAEPSADASAPAPERKRDISRDTKSFHARIRHEIHTFVRALAARDYEEAQLALHPESTLDQSALESAMDKYHEQYATLVIDGRSRTADRTLIEQLEPHLFRVRHTLVDPDEDNMWFAEGRIDLREDTAPQGVLIRLEHLGS